MKIIHLIFFATAFLCTGQGTIAQKVSSDTVPHKTLPVVRHLKKSLLPDTLYISGHLDDYPARGYCGIFCIGGTIKVKLKEMIPDYNSNYVYLITACLSDKVTKGATINVVASKLKIKEDECYYNSITNIFNSNGMPFYKLSATETRKIK